MVHCGKNMKDHKNLMTKRFSVSLTPQVEKDFLYLQKLGYTPAEIGREGIRLFAAKKKAEASA
jgi:hypothetical protein